jgi:hypothetical protein
MSDKLPLLSGKEVIRVLKSIDFESGIFWPYRLAIVALLRDLLNLD